MSIERPTFGGQDAARINSANTCGQHRNRALAAWRRTRAVELAVEGFTYQQIADELGYANRGTVHRIVQRTLEARLAEGVDELRELEVARLDALQAGLWDAASSGDARACGTILKIIDRRCRLLGLYASSSDQTEGLRGAAARSPMTVVIDSP